MKLLATSPDLAELYERLEQAGFPKNAIAIDVLDPVEKRRMWAWGMSLRSHWENLVFQSELGCEDYMLGTEFGDEMLRTYAERWRQLNVPVPGSSLSDAIKASEKSAMDKP